MHAAIAAQGLCATVASRGLHAPIGRRPHPHARNAAAQHGISLAQGKRSQQVNSQDLQQALVVLVMEARQRQQVQQQYPQASGKCFLLSHWQDNADIADPLHDLPEVFIAQWQQMQQACELWLARLLQAGMLQHCGKTEPHGYNSPDIQPS